MYTNCNIIEHGVNYSKIPRQGLNENGGVLMYRYNVEDLKYQGPCYEQNTTYKLQ